MNWNRTNSASYFSLDSNNSGAAAGGSPAGSGSTAPAGGSPAPVVPSTGTNSDAGSVPVEAGVATPPSDSPQSGDSFAGMEDDLDFVDLGDSAAPGAIPEAVSDPSKVAPAPAVPAVASPPETAPVPAGAGAAPPSNASAGPRSKVESFLADMNDENLAALSSWAAENPFKLSSEEAAALDTDAMSVIPKLMGRVYAQALKSAASMIQNFAPEIAQQAITKHQTVSAKSSEAMQEFFTSNPELNSKDHQATVDKWAKVFRAQNPKASRAEAIKFVGLAVKTELGIAPGAPGSVGAAQGRAVPFAPARPGGKAPVTQQADDAYAGLDFDFDS